MSGRRFAVPLLGALLAAAYLAVPPAPAQAQAQETSAAPKLYTTPTCLNGDQTTIQVRGRNFEPGRAVDVWDFYDTQDPLYGNSVPVTPDAYGTFTTSLPIDLHYASFHRVAAVYGDDTGFYLEGTLIVGGCQPKLNANPKCGDAPVPSIAVSGSGFVVYSYDVIVVTVTDQNQNVVGQRTIDPVERFDGLEVDLTSSLFPDGVPEGGYTVEAIQGSDPQDENYRSAVSGFLVPCPVITVEPVCAARSGAPPETMELIVTATGFITGQTLLEIVFDPGGKPQEFWGYGGDGTYTIAPYRRPDGVYTILAKQGYFAGSVYSGLYFAIYPADTDRRLTEATTTFTVTCDEPTLIPPVTAPPSGTTTTVTANSACGAPQLENDMPLTLTVPVSGTGFLSGTVILTFDPGGDNEQAFIGTALGDGTFNESLPIRAGPDGVFVIRAHQDVVGAFVPDAETTFTVPCLLPLPVLTTDQPCGDPAAGVPAAYFITLFGTGFLPGRVELTFDAAGLAPEVLPPAIVDANGVFSALLSPSGRGPGKYEIVAHQQVSGSALAVDQGTSFLVACTGPFFRLMSDSGPRGFVVTVFGENFPGETDIMLRWSRGINASRPIVVHTDLNGKFTRQVLIFNSDFMGMRELTVELASDPLALATLLPAPYRVTAGTVSPPFSLAGNPYAGPDATIVMRR